ncbi:MULTISPECIES: sulfurtransferase [Methanothrix]|jgi:thiosulfate/3-mercaptopyruvate sulfurtransferase|uniref:Rhodanese-related sulfurtransferase-like protein n=2 Tax=Methanothrix TaxID=2222 RepID=A0B8P4_METTP|nr:rhodanese-like domain-containing protein [Methanothrix thermoacetophila]ABK15068.1 Rhodanese-related sulfurtransferase-like protein [Methanothrix thermoacetophila PT]
MIAMTIQTATILMVSAMLLSLPAALAGCACSAGGTWDPYAFLNYNPAQSVSPSAEGKSTAMQDDYRSDDFPNGDLLRPMPSVSSSDTVLAITENLNDGIYVKGAMRLSRGSLVNQNGTLKSPEEIASALGSIGVTNSDRIVVYGDDLEDAALGFFALKYVGHRDVSLLDGDVERWQSMGLPVQNVPSVRDESAYIPNKQNLVATYDYVMSGEVQIVDARPFRDFGLSRIPGAVHIDSERARDGDRIADNETLMELFAPLQIDRPVVVYSENPGHASIVWFALQLMGYNAMIYPWSDWISHSPTVAQNAPGALGRSSSSVTDSESTESRYRKLGR